MILAGVAIVLLTFYAIIKNYETRIVLMASGILMSLIGGDVMGAVNTFSKELVNDSLVPIICITMGFSWVLDYTGCSKHLVVFATGILKRGKFMIVPATIILVWCLNIALISAAGLAAAVGAILIPTLIRLGISPVVAASALLLGTWGSSVSPGNPFIVQVADLAKMNVMQILPGFAPKAGLAVIVSCIAFMVPYYLNRKEAGETETVAAEETFKVNPVYALIPLIPIILLIISSPLVHWLKPISVANAMLIGTLLCLLATRANVKEFTKAFFKGAGEGFAEIVCLIAAAAVFSKGMNVIGLTGALIESMKQSAALAKVAAAFGPFLFAAISGSGNAAVLAFNGTITPHAASFGLSIADMGSVVQATGNLGRCMSPVAGVAIICAKLAGVNPVELAKRNALPCILATITLMVLVLF